MTRKHAESRRAPAPREDIHCPAAGPLADHAAATRRWNIENCESVPPADCELKRPADPSGESCELDLGCLIDIEAVQKLMDEFYAVAHIPMSIIDRAGRVLVGVGWQDICVNFHRADSRTSQFCRESDIELSADMAQGEMRLYKCKNNMWDIATPIFVAGQHVGNIFSGQFFFEGETIDRELFREQARKYGFDENEYLAALDRVPRLSRHTVDHGMAFFLKLADTLSQLGHSNHRLGRLLAERDRLAGSLRQAKDAWERTFDAVPDLIAILDTSHRIVKANRAMADRLGTTPEECVGLHCYHAVHGASCAPASCPHRQTCMDGREHTAEVHEDRLGGDFLVTTTPLRDGHGRQIGSVHVARDITALKRAEDELRTLNATLELRVAEQTVEIRRGYDALREANETLERRVAERTEELARSNDDLQQFAYVASHDLKEPLRVMAGFVGLLKERYAGQLDEQADRWIRHIADGSVRMANLIDDLLTYSRVDRAGQDFAAVDLAAPVQDALANLRTAVAEANAHVEVGELPTVRADRTQMVLLFQNLISNAIKFRRQDAPAIQPIVSVSAAAENDNWIVRVRDNGIGIEPAYNELIFLIFQRLHRRDDYPGTGIGLAICKRIVERHGGRIWVESQPGAGATFCFSLPAKLTAEG